MTWSASASATLPFVPQPFPGEMLSSWLGRIAAEYGISLERLARHLRLSASRPVEIDHASTRDDIKRTAAALSVPVAEIQAMVHRPLMTPVWRLRERYTPVQVCTRCRADHASRTNEPVAIMAWFEYWRIECQQCRLPFSAPGRPNLNRSNPAREDPEWFGQILPFARRGATLLAAFARRPHRALVSPVAILRLLSMRHTPPGPAWMTHYGAGCDHRIAGFFLPGLTERLCEHPLLPTLWTDRHPVRLVTARIILLAAMANFLAEPTAAFSRLIGELDWPRRRAVERWLYNLPDHSAQALDPGRQIRPTFLV